MANDFRQSIQKAEQGIQTLINKLTKLDTQITTVSNNAAKNLGKVSQALSPNDINSKLKSQQRLIDKLNKELKEQKILINQLTTAKRKHKQVTKLETAAVNQSIIATKRQTIANKQAALSFRALSVSIKQAFSRFIGFTLISAAIFGLIRIVGDLTKRIGDFDKTMTNLSAILQISRSDLSDLEDKIKAVAGESIKTSNEVAKLAETLVVLGKTKEEIIQLLEPINNLSIGLQATSQETGELLIMTMNAFGASSREASRYADIIAKMRTSTALDFERIKNALAFLAPTANAAGLSLEKAAAILGVLVDNGVKAARAGRLTSTMFLRLATDGKTLGDALDQVNEAQKRNITEVELLALANELFGKRAGALGLILANNRDEVAKLTEEFEKSKGTLQDLTDVIETSLIAKLTKLDSIYEKIVLNIESGNGVLAKFFKLLVSFPIKNLTRWDNLNTILESQEGKMTRLIGLWSTFNFFTNKHAQNIVDRIIKEDEYNKMLQDAVTILREYNIEGEKQLNLIKITAFLRGFSVTELNDFVIAMTKGVGVNKDLADSEERVVEVIDREIAALKLKRVQQSSTNEDWIFFTKRILALEKEREIITGKNNKVDRERVELLDGSIAKIKEIIKLNRTRIILELGADDPERKRLIEVNKQLEKSIGWLGKLHKLTGGSATATEDDFIPGLTPTLIKLERAKTLGEELIVVFEGLTSTFGDIFDIDMSKFEFLFNENTNTVKEWADLSKELIGGVLDASLKRFEVEIQQAQIARDLILENDLASNEEKENARKKFDQEQRRINARKAKEERINNLIKIAVDTASAIVEALPNIPLSIAVGAIGLAQASIVASQPLPKFEGGTTDAPKGWALTQEKRAEPITDMYGRLKTMGSDRGAMLTPLSEHDIVYKSKEDFFRQNSGDAINKAVWNMNMASNGEELSKRFVDNSLLNEIKGLRKDNVDMNKKIMRLGSRPIKNNVTVQIEDKRAY